MGLCALFNMYSKARKEDHSKEDHSRITTGSLGSRRRHAPGPQKNSELGGVEKVLFETTVKLERVEKVLFETTVKLFDRETCFPTVIKNKKSCARNRRTCLGHGSQGAARGRRSGQRRNTPWRSNSSCNVRLQAWRTIWGNRPSMCGSWDTFALLIARLGKQASSAMDDSVHADLRVFYVQSDSTYPGYLGDGQLSAIRRSSAGASTG